MFRRFVEVRKEFFAEVGRPGAVIGEKAFGLKANRLHGGFEFVRDDAQQTFLEGLGLRGFRSVAKEHAAGGFARRPFDREGFGFERAAVFRPGEFGFDVRRFGHHAAKHRFESLGAGGFGTGKETLRFRIGEKKRSVLAKEKNAFAHVAKEGRERRVL